MGTFISQDSTPTLWTDKDAAPGLVYPQGLDEHNVWRAGDAQTVKAALLDIRTHLRGLGAICPADSAFGAVGDDSTDNTDALLAAIAAAKAGDKRRIWLPPGVYRFSGTLEFKDVYGLTFCGPARDKAILKWAGSSGSPMVKLTNTQNVTLESMQFVGNTSGGSRPSAAVESVSDTTYARTYVPTASIFRDLLIGTGSADEFTYGIKYTNTGTSSDTNNSEGAFHAVKIQGVTEACVLFAHAQSKCHHFFDCGFVGGKAGIRTNPSGAFAWHSGNISNMSETCFDLGASNDYILISGLTSEGCKRLLTVGPSGNGWPITILGSRFDSTDIHADGRAIMLGCRGPLTVKGCTFNQAMKIATNWQTQPGGVVEVSGCSFDWTNAASASIIEHTNYGGEVRLFGNTYGDAVGAAYGIRPDNEALTFNVRRFGANGDGIVDDTAAIQAALDAAQTFGGGVVFFPKGTYRITDRLTIGTRFVSEDDVVWSTGYNLSGAASFNATNLNTARGKAFVDVKGEGASAVIIWCNWTGSTGKAAFHYAVSTSDAKANTYNGTVSDLTIIGNEGMTGSPPTLASISNTAAMPGGNHQVGLFAALAPIKVERVYVREMARGFVMSDCYWSAVDNCQVQHCGTGFTFLAANAAHGRNNVAVGCRDYGFIMQGQGFSYEGPHTEQCAVSLYVPDCDNGKVLSPYWENTYSGDTDWQVKLGNVSNAAPYQVIAFSLLDAHLGTTYGKAVRCHSTVNAIFDNLRTYTSGSSANTMANNACSVLGRGRGFDVQRNAFDSSFSFLLPGSGGANGGALTMGARGPGDPGVMVNSAMSLAVLAAAPSSLAGVAGAAGSLADGTYYYTVIAFNVNGGQTDRALEISVAVSAGGVGSVALTWDAVQGADRYYVFRGTTSGGQDKRYTVSTNSYTDTGAAATTATPGDSAGWLNAIRFNSASDSFFHSSGNMGWGAIANANVKFDMAALTKPFRPPCMTSTARDALTGVTGSIIYNTTTNKLNVYTGAAWEAVTSV